MPHSENRSIDRRTEILSAAQALFTHHGFEKTSMSEIAQAAGVSRTVLYRHFSNKDEVFEGIGSLIADEARVAIESVFNRSGNLEEKLEGVLAVKRSLLQHITGTHYGAEILNLIMTGPSRRHHDLVIERVETAVESALSTASQSGEIDLSGNSARSVARVIHAAIDGPWLRAVADDGDVTAFNLEAKALVRLLMRGLTPQ